MTFKNKRTGQETMGKPVDAVIQLSDHPGPEAFFVLYESLDGHGFFLRENSEFYRKFKAVMHVGDTITWTHKQKGGSYRVNPGLFLYDGDDVEWELSVHDGHVMKAFVYRNGDLRFVNDFSQKFVQVPEQVRVNFNVKVPDAAKFKATQAQVGAQIAATVKKAKGRADHPYKYVSEHAIPVPKWVPGPGKVGSINGKTPEEFASTKDIYKEAADNIMEKMKADHAQNFIQYYMDGTTHVALVKRTGCGYVPIRGANLAEVMRAANALLWSKS